MSVMKTKTDGSDWMNSTESTESFGSECRKENPSKAKRPSADETACGHFSPLFLSHFVTNYEHVVCVHMVSTLQLFHWSSRLRQPPLAQNTNVCKITEFVGLSPIPSVDGISKLFA